MSASDTITVAVAARNEEAGLAGAVSILMGVLPQHFEQYEVLIYDDGSTDSTGKIAENLARSFDHIEVISHSKPQGVGGVIRAGLKRSRMNYFIWLDGKGATTASALHEIFSLRDQADLVIPYPTNSRQRPWFRRLISRVFLSAFNVLFRLNLHYYTHLVLCRSADARHYPSRSTSPAAQAEMLVQMIRAGHTYVEVGVQDNFDFKWHHTKAFHLRNIIAVAAVLFRLTWVVYVRRQSHREARTINHAGQLAGVNHEQA